MLLDLARELRKSKANGRTARRPVPGTGFFQFVIFDYPRNSDRRNLHRDTGEHVRCWCVHLLDA